MSESHQRTGIWFNLRGSETLLRRLGSFVKYRMKTACFSNRRLLVGLAGFEPTTFAQEQRDADPYGFL